MGQYFPGHTIVHRLDPRVKLILTIVYITALFTAVGFISYLLMLVVLITCISLSRIRLKTILSGLRPIIIVITLTAFLHIFFTTGTVIAQFKILTKTFTITREGVTAGAYMVTRLVMLIAGTQLLTYTTSPIALTDGLELLMGPLKKIRVPVHELSMMMSIAMRFIPTLIEEADKVMSAQKARGADFETGGLIKRARAILPIIIPLFTSAFRRADELAIAMESRCYHGGQGMTRMKTLSMKTRDYLALFDGAAVLAAVIILGRLGI